MILRNKKTGEIIRFYDGIFLYGKEYFSIAKLKEEWEDYEPVESLIKDEKIRKTVRTWAEVLHIDRDNIKVSIGSHRTSIIGWQPGLIGGYSIDFPNILKGLHDGMQTTIAELCGEEE